LAKRYQPSNFLTENKNIQRNVLEFLSLWVSLFPSHFFKDEEMFHLLHLFIYNVVTDPAESQVIARELQRKSNGNYGVSIGPNPIYPPSLSNLTFAKISPIELARQFALIDFDIFKNISLQELLEPKNEKKNITAFTNHFNSTTLLAQASVLFSETKKDRLSSLSHIISTAKECRKLNDYFTMVALMNAFNSPQIVRLKGLNESFRSKLSSSQKAELQLLIDLVSPLGNYKKLRAEINQATTPLIPFLGMFQADIFFISEANTDLIPNTDLYNIPKRKLLAGVCRTIFSFQQKPYKFTPIQQVKY
jgi:hypothetical protein